MLDVIRLRLSCFEKPHIIIVNFFQVNPTMDLTSINYLTFFNQASHETTTPHCFQSLCNPIQSNGVFDLLLRLSKRPETKLFNKFWRLIDSQREPVVEVESGSESSV